MTADLAAAGQLALEESGTYPAFGYAGEVLYRFTIHGGTLIARPCAGPGVMGDPPPMPVSPGPQPTGTPIAEAVSAVAALPGEALRALSREFEREIASVKASGAISDPPPGVQPTGTSLKSIETPDYLKTSVRSLY